MHKHLYEALNINPNKKEVLSFVGGGGKTTAIFALANELKALGKKVLITTTTKIFVPEDDSFDLFFLKDIEENKINPNTITILGESILDGKLIDINIEKLESIIKRDLFDFVLIEADGAKRKPIKAPNDYEPIITISTTKTIGVVGLDSLHRNIIDTSHRTELLLNILGKESRDKIEIEDIIKLVLHKKGLFKDSKGEKILVLNKAVEENIINEARLIRKDLNYKDFKIVVIADILSKKFY